MFDSPMEQCPVCGQMVALDQTKAECSRRHGCQPVAGCPLETYFVDVEGRPDPSRGKLPGSK
jgi:hypothetical protein